MRKKRREKQRQHVEGAAPGLLADAANAAVRQSSFFGLWVGLYYAARRAGLSPAYAGAVAGFAAAGATDAVSWPLALYGAIRSLSRCAAARPRRRPARVRSGVRCMRIAPRLCARTRCGGVGAGLPAAALTRARASSLDAAPFSLVRTWPAVAFALVNGAQSQFACYYLEYLPLSHAKFAGKLSSLSVQQVRQAARLCAQCTDTCVATR